MSRREFTRARWIALFLEHEAPRTECTFWFIFIIITAAVSARALRVRCVYSRRLPRHPVSCLSYFRFSRVHARNPEIQHVTNAPRLHGYTLYDTSWPKPWGHAITFFSKKLLRIISTRLWFSSKSLKYLKIYPTFHEYPKEPKAILVRRRTCIHQRSLQMVLPWPEFSKKEIALSQMETVFLFRIFRAQSAKM